MFACLNPTRSRLMSSCCIKTTVFVYGPFVIFCIAVYNRIILLLLLDYCLYMARNIVVTVLCRALKPLRQDDLIQSITLFMAFIMYFLCEKIKRMHENCTKLLIDVNLSGKKQLPMFKTQLFSPSHGSTTRRKREKTEKNKNTNSMTEATIFTQF